MQCVFPNISNDFKKKYEYDYLKLYAFGTKKQDLEINFNTLSKPELVTRILHSCTKDNNDKIINPDFLWELPISTRLECLLLISLMVKTGEIEHIIKCKNEECIQHIGITLTLENIKGFLNQINRSEFISVNIQDYAVILRKPTGYDQLKWLEKTYNSKTDIIKEIILNQIIDKETFNKDNYAPLLVESYDIISKIMEQNDPLINLNFSISCPYCGTVEKYSLNIQELALNVLQETQEKIVENIHLLAFHYHWSEQEILSLPIWRRQKYILLIKEQHQ